MVVFTSGIVDERLAWTGGPLSTASQLVWVAWNLGIIGVAVGFGTLLGPEESDAADSFGPILLVGPVGSILLVGRGSVGFVLLAPWLVGVPGGAASAGAGTAMVSARVWGGVVLITG
jgi:hypothetical protein